jgi:hypothetical protein
MNEDIVEKITSVIDFVMAKVDAGEDHNMCLVHLREASEEAKGTYDEARSDNEISLFKVGLEGAEKITLEDLGK